MTYLEPKLLLGTRLSPDLMPQVTREPDEHEKDTPEPTIFKAAEALTKGIEIPLPHGHSFLDKDGIKRERMRVRWWQGGALTYREAALLDESIRSRLPDVPVPVEKCAPYDSDKPLFFGHYWLTGRPQPLTSKIACVDYSAGKEGPLCAYRWEGEPILMASGFCAVGGTDLVE